jgi:regulator of protease activity HflC (stomatin/prohibitin superfamily)
MIGTWVALIGVGIVLALLIHASIRIVNEYDRLVVFRFGRAGPDLIRGPGLVFLIPIVDRPVRVDLREQFIEVPSQTTITKDNAPINIDFLIYWRIAEPLDSVIKVNNFAGALQGIVMTTLRAVIGDILLDVLSRRDQINAVLRVKLDEQTERWGGKVTTVEIREIIPPREVQEAMNRMLSAERNRRAVITESEGQRQSTINVAEGDKAAAILRAEGERQSAILRAEGFALALDKVFSVAQTGSGPWRGQRVLDAVPQRLNRLDLDQRDLAPAMAGLLRVHASTEVVAITLEPAARQGRARRGRTPWARRLQFSVGHVRAWATSDPLRSVPQWRQR